MTNTPLGTLSPEDFLQHYWHKKPLLIRQAIHELGPLVDFEVLKQLAMQDDVESRLVSYQQGQWRLEHGPFRTRRFAQLPADDWTLLVQSVNHHLPHIDDLLWRFNFIPYARLDDVMISYAPPGGTVGPHFDAYDVFLLQVGGRKRWQISAQHDDAFIENAPIRVLKEFKVEQEFILEHGDMLYLPPHYAHYGVALDPGMTYSIGFRAPPAQELATQFLIYLQDHLCAQGAYADPDLKLQANPAYISEEMVEQVRQLLTQIRWGHTQIRDFLGHYLTEPKAHVFYDAPDEVLDTNTFAQHVAQHGLVLDRKSQILFSQDAVYCNGERLSSTTQDVIHWQQFANTRQFTPQIVGPTMLASLYDGYLSGYWQLCNTVAK